MSNKKKPVGMAFDITTGKSYKVYQPEPETITLTMTREQAEAISEELGGLISYIKQPLGDLYQQIEEKLK